MEPTILETASELNNQAVDLLGSKHVIAAAKLFQKAFDTFRASSFEEKEDGEEGNPPPHFGEPNPPAAFPDLEHGHVHPDLIKLSFTLSPNNVFPMCPCTFRLPTGGASKHLDENGTAAILIYNLALAHYCVGLIRMKHDLILKALLLNEMARSLISGEQAMSCSDSASSNKQLALVRLSLEMNSGHLFFHIANFDKAAKCQESLFSSLRHARTDPDVWMFFFAPIFHLEQFGMPSLAPQA